MELSTLYKNFVSSLEKWNLPQHFQINSPQNKWKLCGLFHKNSGKSVEHTILKLVEHTVNLQVKKISN